MLVPSVVKFSIDVSINLFNVCYDFSFFLQTGLYHDAICQILSFTRIIKMYAGRAKRRRDGSWTWTECCLTLMA